MKKMLSLTVAAMMAFSLFNVPVYADEAQVLTVNPALQKQTLEGWGTSLCWWGNAIGTWNNQDKRDEIVSLLFDQQNGLGLNMVRYNIGGGENSSHDHMRVKADIPSYQPEAGIWDWDADKGQLDVLKASIQCGADILEAFTNAPPYWMTYSKCAAGSVTGATNNLYDDAYDNFAEYVTDVMLYLKEKEGITFRTLAPLNEPSSVWWIQNNNQEGCHFDRDKQDMLIREMGDKLRQKGLSTEISAPEEYNIDDSLKTFNSYSSAAKQYIGQINTHTYKGSNRQGLQQAAALAGKRLWVSEVGIGGTAPHSHDDMTSAMQLAQTVLADIRDMGVDGWAYWQAVEDEAGNNNYGFIHANFSGNEEYWITKQYYAMANFSKFIRPGSIVLKTADQNTLATYNPKSGQISVVVVNPNSASKSYPLDFSGFDTVGTQVNVYRTSAQENCQMIEAPSIEGNTVAIQADPNTITTITLQGQYSGYHILNDNDTGVRLNQFDYHGNWEYYDAQTGAYQQDNHYSATAGDEVSLVFWGTGVKVYAAKASNHGMARVLIDGEEKQIIDYYAPNREEQAEVYAIEGLEPGYHTLTIRVLGEKNPSAAGNYVTVDHVDVVNNSTQFPTAPVLPDYQARNNIALGANVIADSTQRGHEASHAVDGNLESRWCANNSSNGHWLQVEFDRAVNIIGSEITFGIPAQYKIDVSPDGETWQQVIVKDTFGEQRQEDVYEANGVKYVRVTITELQSGAWASIDDFKVYSDSIKQTDDNCTVPVGNYFTYTGAWQYNWYENNAYLKSNHYSNNAGDECVFVFEGENIQLFAAKADSHGIATISIDGQEPIAVDLYSNTRQDNTLVFERNNLTAGVHTAKIVVSGTANTAAKDCYVTVDRAITW